MQNKGLIWASDRAEWRLKNLKRRAARAGVFNYRSAAWNGGPKLPTRTLFDGVLVDAPCSGVGTWGRNPNARWTTVPQDVLELAAVQKELLLNAAKAVKPGGKLVYSVCTLTRKETEEVARAVFLGPDWTELNLGAGTTQAGGRLTIFPEDYASNGMFIAGWRRNR
jgi:16S rRNA (cytosine967-C5)-methyltransferase